jgi:SAM-dependent methyltransferase
MKYLKLKHDPYGHKKRYDFFVQIIKKNKPKNILDLGCGTCEMLTTPLASTFKGITFYGVDSDEESISIAKKNNSNENLNLYNKIEEINLDKFDLIIASEVIEHVDDPYNFLLNLRNRLNINGVIMITVPNGFGPFEIGTLFENIIYVLGLYKFINKFKAIKNSNVKDSHQDTVANSPHLNYFTLNQLKSLFFESGLLVLEQKSRTFICGPFFDKIVTFFHLSNFNASIADILHSSICSDWMFELKIVNEPRVSNWKRGYWATKRMNFNLKRAGLLK